jgi:dTDP-4-dehydrorhamnose reductase
MIWLVGSKGMLGTEVFQRLSARNVPHIASDLDVDITDPAAVELFVSGKPLSWMINCSAYTAVDRAEKEREKAFRINADGVANLARLAGVKGAKLIHISTDYVFDGTKEEAYEEDDPPCPTGAYGASKYEGEQRIMEAAPSHFLLRTAWLYGLNGNNFVYTMLKLFRERDEVRVVADQWGSPTLASDLAEVILRLVAGNSRAFGIYHYTNEGRTNWFDFAREIQRQAHQKGLLDREIRLVPIATDQYPTPAQRPANSYLSKEKIKMAFNITIRPWQEALADFMNALAEKKESRQRDETFI